MRFRKIYNIVERYIELNQAKMLDIGCSTGKFTAFLRPEVKGVSGLDISEAAIEKARAKGLEDVYQVDVEKDGFPFKEETFDLVFCMEVLEHLFSEKNVMSEVKRVLKPDGLFVVTVPNDVLHWRMRFKILFDKIPFQEKLPHKTGHLRFFSNLSLKRTMKENNFEVVSCTGLPLSYKGVSLGWLGHFFSNVLPDFSSKHYIIISKKN